MSIRFVSGRPGPIARGTPLVCVLVGEREQEADATLEALLARTERSVTVLLVGPSGALAILEPLVTDVPDRSVGLVRAERGEAAAFNAAVVASSPGDLVLVCAGTNMAEGWIERLRSAACSDSTVASATPLSMSSGALGIAPAEGMGSLAEVAEAVAEHSLALRPKIAVVGPSCAYIRRSALDLAAPLDESAGLGLGLEKLALELLGLGMVHVLADDAIVESSGDVQSTAAERSSDSGATSDGLRSIVTSTLAEDDHGSLRRALGLAGSVLRRMSVTIDGRALSPAVGGTQTYVIGLILGLARSAEIDLRVLVPADLSERAAQALASVPQVSTISIEQAQDDSPPSDVVHRPQQVFTPDDLLLLRGLGHRLVVGQQDLIAYHNHTYHRDSDTWRAFRRTTRLALAAADQTIFFSEHARRDALSEDLLAPARAHVVGIGAESFESPHAAGTAPEGLLEGPFLLCLGADYAHKNRPFAIKLTGALRELGWDGFLVLAGPHVPCGSSAAAERLLLGRDTGLGEWVVDLGAVDEPTRAWLVDHACGLAYPTLYEGFGLLPLEAARAGVPCLFAAQASLEELAADAATLVPWDAAASASAVLPLFVDGPAREAHVSTLRGLERTSWDEIVNRLVAVYRRALQEPPSEAAPRMWQELEREGYIPTLESLAQRYQDAYHSLESRVRIGLPLIDDEGLLSPDEQRGLMRLAARGRFGRALMRPLGLIGRARGSS